MAIPFRVFESSYARFGYTNYVWCVRCEAWVPVNEAYDPHVQDHIQVWHALGMVEEAA